MLVNMCMGRAVHRPAGRTLGQGLANEGKVAGQGGVGGDQNGAAAQAVLPAPETCTSSLSCGFSAAGASPWEVKLFV